VSSDLRPEHITTYQAVLETSPSENLRLVGALFQNRIKNLIVYGIDPATSLNQFRNEGRATTKGLELEAEYAWKSGPKLRASYTLQRSDDAAGAELENSPQQLAKLNTSIPVAGNWRAGND
jgi:iron complex outermembrane receptor protein